MHITSSFAYDNLENNDQVILPGLETGTFWVISTHDNDYNEKSWQDKVKIFFIILKNQNKWRKNYQQCDVLYG